MIYPVIWLVASSFKDNHDIFVNASSLIPQQWFFSNYVDGWKGIGGISFSVFFKNAFIITILATVGTVISSAAVAYGFARIEFKGRQFWFACMMVSMMLPAQVQIIPQYLLFHRLDWINTFYPLIVPFFFGIPFFIFLMMQFIRGLPAEMDSAAKIDGCGTFTIFTRIILPLIGPAIITTVIFSFYWKWEDFFGPLLYLNNPRKYPVSVALQLFSDPNSVSNWGGMFAMSVLSLIPVIAIFVFFQKYIVEGMVTSGIKG
jgi:multiple sugar transport system permease protein